MLMIPHGGCTRPAVATLSTWDPFVKGSADFVRIFVSYAHRHGFDAAALLIDPTPAAVVKGEREWPYFQDAATRTQLLLDCGVDAVGVIEFAQDDLAAGALEFFDVVTAQWPLAEFWLRSRQSLGSGAKGSASAVRTECLERGVKLRHMKRFIDDVGVLTRASLQQGSVQRASSAAHSLPTFRRPECGTVRLPWQPGEYRAVGAAAPSAEAVAGEDFPLFLHASPDGVARLSWPDPSIEYLRFTAGPADLAGDQRDYVGAGGAAIVEVTSTSVPPC